MNARIKVTKLKLTGALKGMEVTEEFDLFDIDEGIRALANNPRIKVGAIRKDLSGGMVQIIAAQLIVENQPQ